MYVCNVPQYVCLFILLYHIRLVHHITQRAVKICDLKIHRVVFKAFLQVFFVVPDDGF
jgi:hypothetical protein